MNNKNFTLTYSDLYDWNFKYYIDSKVANIYIELPIMYLNRLNFNSGHTNILIDDLVVICMSILDICVTNDNDRIMININAGEVKIDDINLNKVTLYGSSDEWVIPSSEMVLDKIKKVINQAIYTNRQIDKITINKLNCKIKPITIGDSVDILLSELQNDQDITRIIDNIITYSNNEYFLIKDTKDSTNIPDSLNLTPHKRKFNIVFYRSVHDTTNKMVLGMGELNYISEYVFRIKI